ncbi:DUF2252 family protein [Sphingomonas bacterium]|uniref:DUF2252 family protein n=1 Tax=Sphingomonas bacterium TaxID=1895847 RepID=UPI001576B8BA|nr:DUF2252 family protein [Sphingomonas bacterium]
MTKITGSVARYEDWLREQLGDELVEADLARKHDRMRSSAFAFLRATYWRWSETIGSICPEALLVPPILSIGDTHLENFGTWRDADGRLVWGANDFDEAAVMPYVLDLIRLAASAMLASNAGPKGAICDAIWNGYAAGLAAPGPVILERDHRWLRETILLPEKERAKWWAKLDRSAGPVPLRFQTALAAAMPERDLSITMFARSAGTGSLGRPRYVAVAEWLGGPVVREGKAILPAAWATFGPGKSCSIKAGDIAAGRNRAVDPHYRIVNELVVRRLSPNSRKIEVEDAGDLLMSQDLLKLMGREIACCHAGDSALVAAVRDDVKQRDGRCLEKAARAAADAIMRDYKAYA